jgi:type II secretion system protein N
MAQNNSVEVSIQDASFAWWNGYEIDGIKISALPLKEGVPPLLEIARLQARPEWNQLLRGNYSAGVLWGEIYGGTIDVHGNLREADRTVDLRLDWSDVEIRRYRAATNWLDEGRLTGTLAGWFEGQMPIGSIPQGEGEIFLQHASINGGKIKGFTVPDLSIDDAKSKFTLKGDKLEIPEAVLSGSDITIKIKGNITVREPLAQSIPNLQMTIDKLPESIKPLVTVFAPRAKTLPAQLQITGTLGRMQVK